MLLVARSNLSLLLGSEWCKVKISLPKLYSFSSYIMILELIKQSETMPETVCPFVESE